MATSTATRKRDSMGRFLPSSTTKRTRRKARQRDEFGRFLPNGSKSKKKKSPPKRVHRTKSKKATAKQITYIALVLDNSASMSQHRDRAQQAYNDICNTIRDQAKQTGQDIRVSFYTFGRDVKRQFFNRDVDSLQNHYYNPHEGATALYQAIRDVSHDFARLPDANDENVSFLVQVITDGLENRRNVSQREIKELIVNNQNSDRWTYAVSCPEHYISSVENALGIFGGNVSGWDTMNRTSMTKVAAQHSRGVSRYIATRAAGQTASRDFFAEVNVGRKSVRQVKKGLTAEDKKRFRILTVDKARKVKDFIESKNLIFEKGRVFYQLNKPEIVQHYKEIILQKRDDPKTFYGGDQVRQKLGIPVGQQGKVSPGNLGEWVVWIQSTSVNRNLLAKMKVLYDKRDKIAPVPYRKY